MKKSLAVFFVLLFVVSIAYKNIALAVVKPTISFSNTKRSVEVGKKLTLKPKITPSSDVTIKWSSSKTSVATVDSKGVVTAKKEGTTVITAMLSNGEKATCTITVTKKDDTMVWIPMTGSKYHSVKTCSNMKNPKQVTLSYAKTNGYTKCKLCW